MAELSEPLGQSRKHRSEPKANILLVDDNPANLLVLRSILVGLGHNLVDAHSGDEALVRILSDEFAVVLLDVHMPGISGFETAKLIRGRNRSRHIPIIFLTANDIERSLIEEGYALGAVDFLVKPILPIVLQAKVRGLVEIVQEKQRAKHEADQLRLLVQGTTEYAIFMLDPEGYIFTWNAGAERLKGYRADEIIGQHFSKFYPQEAIDRGWPAHELKVAKAGGRFEDEGWRVRKDGTQFWANVVITALHDDAGKFVGFSKITRDLTERKKSEENARRLLEEAAGRRAAEENSRLIQEQRERLHVTLASIGDAVISTDAEGRINFLNLVAQELVGWTSEDATNQNLSDVLQIVNEETRQPVENPAMRALTEGKIVGLANHTVLISKEGIERPIDDSAAPMRDAEGNVIGSVLVFRDVSEQRGAAQEGRKNQELLQLIHKIGKIGHWEWNSLTDENKWSPEIEALYGLPPGGFEGGYQGWAKLLHPDDLSKAEQDVRRAMETGEYFSEFRVIWPDGSIHWLETRAHVFKDNQDKPVRIMGVNMDITERKQQEESARFLAEASAALAGVVDFESTLQKVANLAVPYFADWSTVDVANDNGSLRRVTVAHQDANKIAMAHDLIREYPPDPQSPGGPFAVLRTGKPEIVGEITDEMLVQRASDERHLHLIRALGLKSYICVPLIVSGKSFGVLTFATAESGRSYNAADLALAEDLAHRAAVAIENTRLYQALRDNDRRKDEFLATLAHELRNPLAPIRNSLQILKMPRVDAATAQQTRDMMERQVHHLVRLVDDLLDVSRVMRGKIELRKEPAELATIVARAVETAKPLIEVQGHQLNLSVSPESLLLDADPIRLAQVVGNLLTNSAKYSEPNGYIWLTAQREGDQAVLKVRDTGIGIAPDMLPHVFELFVQADHACTKAQGGLGIGLTLVKNLVEMHDGSVEAHSAGLGKGCEFVVSLPLMSQKTPQPANAGLAEQNQAMPNSGQRLLVVDDNQDAATSLSMLLRLQGHEVRVAHDGPSALEAATTFRPDLIFLDLGMPGMDGYEVARRVRKMPGLEKTILAALTGWGQQEDRRRTTEAGFHHHLVKPPEPKALENLLASLPKRQ